MSHLFYFPAKEVVLLPVAYNDSRRFVSSSFKLSDSCSPVIGLTSYFISTLLVRFLPNLSLSLELIKCDLIICSHSPVL